MPRTICPPRAISEIDQPSRTDLHRLFDRGYVTIDEQIRRVVGRRLKADFDNGRSYYQLHGTASWADPSGRVRERAPAT